MRLFFALALLPGIVFAGVNVPTPEPPTQSQNQGQAQNQGQSQQQQSSATNGLSYSVQDRLQIPHAPAPTAPAVFASGPCNTGDSRAITTPIGGVSKGKSTADANCDRREVARVLTPLNPALALRVLCSDPYVAAVATPEDCIYTAPVVPGNVTKADLEQVRQENIKRVDAAFKQSQAK